MRTTGMGTPITRYCLALMATLLLASRAPYRANREAFMNSKMRLFGTLAAVLALFALFSLVHPAGAFAQAVAGLGAAAGTVRDSSGAAVPGATVVVSNDSKGIRRTMQTTEAGLFAAPALVPADAYKITVSKTGFATWEVKDFQIHVGQVVDFSITLEISAVTAQVEVSAVPLVEDTKTDVSQVVTSQQILDLPINGRRVDSFALLTPAVVPDGNFGLLLPYGWKRYNQPVLQRERRTHPYSKPDFARSRARVPGGFQ